MTRNWTPLRWPAQWKSAASLELLKGTPFNCVVGAEGAAAQAARAAAIETVTPPDVTVIEGVWPGICMAQSVSAGPTGEPWVNSNLWAVRLARARYPEAQVWVSAKPLGRDYDIAIADAAMAGGRWIVTLDDVVAAGVLEGRPEAVTAWKRIVSYAAYFAARDEWAGYEPRGVIGLVSDFSTAQTREVLNLITRSGQQYRVIPADRCSGQALAGLKSVLAPGSESPAAPVRAAVTRFASDGGLAIVGKAWEPVRGAVAKQETHPRFALFALGKGTVAIAKGEMNDPYLLASDAAILVSHRYDLLRFFNGGALSAYYSGRPDGARALAQILFYANRPAEDATVRIAGAYRAAKISSVEQPEATPIHFERQGGGIEIQLPRVSRYAAIELEV